jgi:hypothetical protein
LPPAAGSGIELLEDTRAGGRSHLGLLHDPARPHRRRQPRARRRQVLLPAGQPPPPPPCPHATAQVPTTSTSSMPPARSQSCLWLRLSRLPTSFPSPFLLVGLGPARPTKIAVLIGPTRHGKWPGRPCLGHRPGTKAQGGTAQQHTEPGLPCYALLGRAWHRPVPCRAERPVCSSLLRRD